MFLIKILCHGLMVSNNKRMVNFSKSEFSVQFFHFMVVMVSLDVIDVMFHLSL